MILNLNIPFCVTLVCLEVLFSLRYKLYLKFIILLEADDSLIELENCSIGFINVSPCRFAKTLEIVSLIREMADIKKSRRVSESVKLSAVANLEA